MNNAITLLLKDDTVREEFLRAIQIVGRALSRRINQEFYRYGGPTTLQHYNKVKSGPGCGGLFFIGNTLHAIRLNYDMSCSNEVRITTIDYWENWINGRPAKYTITLPTDLGINAALDAIAGFIRNPGSQKISLDDD